MKTALKGAHKIRIYTSSSDLLKLLVSIVFTALMSFSFNRISQYGNYFLFYGFGIIFLFYFIKRELSKSRVVRRYSKQNKNLLIVGNGKPGRDIATKILHENGTGFNLVGIICDENNFESDLKQLMVKDEIDEILISIENDNYKEVFEAIDICGKYGLTVKLCSKLFTIIHSKIQTENFYGISVMDVTIHKHVKYYNTLKRLIDIGIAVAALIILSPLILTIAIIIKLSSKGPIIYSQKRVGLHGRLFNFYKFRSMYTNDGEDEKRKAMMLEFMVNNKACKIIDENRITAVGRLIRKTSLDELPQLYNVIRGDMSIVGPRPCLWYEFEHYADWQKRRANAIPGCTGIWQVSGRSNVSFNDSIILDLYYLMKMSPVYDIKLILKTIPVMLFSRGGK
jgi:exopolysaccharide biosynthesis polyprenyl glycosylphosphotransferase